MLELAGMLAPDFMPSRTLAFVAFTGEEAGLRGSRRFVSTSLQASRSLYAMVNLDTVGRLGGGKLLAFGTDSAREWPFIVMGAGYTTGLEAQSVPKDPGSGDQVSFLEAGIPAVHLFSGVHMDYHRPSDDVEKIDFKGMVKITEFTREIVVYLGDRKEPLDNKLKGGAQAKAPDREGPGKKTRRASLGTMPDFTYQGDGVRIGAAPEGSPAHAAGLREQDIITGIDEHAVNDLRGFAETLKGLKPGETVTVHIQRGGKKLSFKVTLKER
jgi:hypothetical protein